MFDYLNKEREGTGGILFLNVSVILAVCLVLTVTFIRESTSRSVAETVESTIATQCLASCYTNQGKYGSEGYWEGVGSETTFKSTSKKGADFNPLNTFNETMKHYHLMKDNERAGQTSGESKKFSAEWKRKDYKDSNGNWHASFKIQFDEYTCFDSWWSHIMKIQPSAQKVTTEVTYTLA